MKKLAIIGILVLLGSSIWAQPGRQGKREKVEQLRIAYFSEYLELSVEEGQQFWPLFNAMEGDIKTLRKERKQMIHRMNGSSGSSESEVKQFVQRMKEIKMEEARREAKFLHDCLPILGPDRVVKLSQAEEQFRRTLLREKLRN